MVKNAVHHNILANQKVYHANLRKVSWNWNDAFLSSHFQGAPRDKTDMKSSSVHCLTHHCSPHCRTGLPRLNITNLLINAYLIIKLLLNY